MSEDDKVSRGISDIVHSVAGPLIVFEMSWADTIPDWVKQEITIRRMLQQMIMLRKKDEPRKATDIETLAYMLPCTMIAPMDHDWAHIYLWLAHKCMVDAGQPGAESAAELAPKELNEDQERQLGDLQRWLWGRYENLKRQAHRETKDRRATALVGDMFSQLSLFKEIASDKRPTNGVRKDVRTGVVPPGGGEVQGASS